MHSCDHMEILIKFCEIVVTSVHSFENYICLFWPSFIKATVATSSKFDGAAGLRWFFFLYMKFEPDYSLSLSHSRARWLAYFPVVWQHAWNRSLLFFFFLTRVLTIVAVNICWCWRTQGCNHLLLTYACWLTLGTLYVFARRLNRSKIVQKENLTH